MTRSKKFDLKLEISSVIQDAPEIDDRAARKGVLLIHRLKKDETALDDVVWFSASVQLNADGYDVTSLVNHRPKPSPESVASLIEATPDCELPPSMAVV